MEKEINEKPEENHKVRRIKRPLLPGVSQKNRILLVVSIIVLLLVLPIAVFGVGIYKYNWSDKTTVKVARILSLPAFFVNGNAVTYGKYQEYLKTYDTYTKEFTIKEDQKIDVNSKEAKAILAQTAVKVKELLVKDALVRAEVKKRKIKWTDKEVNDAFTEFVKNTGGDKEVRNNLTKYYGISLEEFRKEFFMDAFISGKLQNAITNDKTLIQEAEKKANDVLEKVKKGEDFVALAKKYSEDQTTGAKGGDLGLIKKGEMVPEFEDAAFKLQKGEVSGVIKTVYGFHIVKVGEIKGEERQVSHILIKTRDFDYWLSEQLKNVKKKYWVK